MMLDELVAWVDEFLAYLDLEQNAAQATIKSYRLNLIQFIEWAGSQNITELNYLVVQDFVKYLREQRQNAANTIAQKLAALKSFFNYLASLKIYI